MEHKIIHCLTNLKNFRKITGVHGMQTIASTEAY